MPPLVTAVCLTGFRHDYVARTVHNFLSQTFMDSELLILDDGRDACHAVVPMHPRIRYEYRQPGTWATVGEKRNAANGMALGDFIIHFDDDDWSISTRIEEQLKVLENREFSVTGYSSILYYRPADGGVFKYAFNGYGHYAVGTTQCYRRDYWKKNLFPVINVGEDSQFSFKAAAKGVLHSIPGLGKIVARSLPNSTAKPNLGDRYFPPARRDEFPQAFWEEETLWNPK
jgi:glycosyl transferase family 2